MARSKPVVVLRSSGPDPVRLQRLIRWVRAMLPAALLVVAPLDGPVMNVPDDAISLDAEVVESGPLALAHALVRAASGTTPQG